MPLNPSALATATKNRIRDDLYGGDLGAIESNIDDMCTIFAEETRNHIVANMDVVVAAGIAVQVNTGTGTGATTAPGTGSVV